MIQLGLQPTEQQNAHNWEDEFNEFHADYKRKENVSSETSSTDELFSSLKVGEQAPSYGDWDKVLFEGTEKLVSFVLFCFEFFFFYHSYNTFLSLFS
jgi:hypothetical protein